MSKQVITACSFLYRDNTVLIAKRADTKAFLPGKYELPGGHVEFGETMEEGLARELMEEFGINIRVGIPFYTFTYLRDADTVHALEVVFFTKLEDPKAIITTNPRDHSTVAWITRKDIPSYYEADDEEGKAIDKGFALLERNTINDLFF